MKKFTLLLVAFIATISTADASEALTFDGWSSWQAGTVRSENTITFGAQWNGGAIYTGKDVSAYDYLVIRFSSVSDIGVQLYISAWDGTTYDDKSNEKWTAGTTYYAGPENLTIAINLNEGSTASYKSRFRALTFQNYFNGGNACAVTSMTFMTSLEYLYGAGVTFLSLADAALNTGWAGSGSVAPSYADKVITFGDATYQGKGWYLGDVDYSSYTKFEVDLATPATAAGQVVVEYVETGKSTTKTFEAGVTSVLVDLNDTYKNHVKQIYFQNDVAKATFTLKRAYAASANYFYFDKGVTPSWPGGFTGQTGSYVVLDRPFKAGWNSVCLPYAVNVSEIAADAAVYSFTSATLEAITLTQIDGGAMEAGVPYFVKAEAAISDPIIFTGKNVSLTAPVAQSAINDYTFTGNFEAGMDMKGKYGVASNAIRLGAAGAKLNAFAAYLEGTTPAHELGITIEDGDVTGISQTLQSVITGEQVFYNLAGQRVDRPAKGLYIVNGKKVIIK